MRKNSSGDGMSTIKVPLSYAPKRKYLERLLENPDLYADNTVAVKLPRMSFEITSMSYDPTRSLAKVNTINKTGTSNATRAKLYPPVPYIINFQLNIYAKTQDDALQVVEQIIPYFTPQYSITVKPLSGFSDIKDDVPVTIQGITFTDDYEGAMEQRRTIIYTIDFEMKINFYGPTTNAKIIRQIDIEYYLMHGGLTDSDTYLGLHRITPDPIGVSPDSDFGFNITYYEAFDSA